VDNQQRGDKIVEVLIREFGETARRSRRAIRQ